jgi:hypothetical protein
MDMTEGKSCKIHILNGQKNRITIPLFVIPNVYFITSLIYSRIASLFIAFFQYKQFSLLCCHRNAKNLLFLTPHYHGLT